MQLITPFPRSVALADPRSAAAAGAGACTQLTRAPAKKREPRLRRSQRADVHSQQELDVTAISATTISVKSFARSVGDGRARTVHEHAHALLLFTLHNEHNRQGSQFLV